MWSTEILEARRLLTYRGPEFKYEFFHGCNVNNLHNQIRGMP
jgi:hypothetical protein